MSENSEFLKLALQAKTASDVDAIRSHVEKLKEQAEHEQHLRRISDLDYDDYILLIQIFQREFTVRRRPFRRFLTATWHGIGWLVFTTLLFGVILLGVFEIKNVAAIVVVAIFCVLVSLWHARHIYQEGVEDGLYRAFRGVWIGNEIYDLSDLVLPKAIAT
ncbi:hypothetical protein WDW86_15665, partial [Bdellovibrionota bacterium FG-2]